MPNTRLPELEDTVIWLVVPVATKLPVRLFKESTPVFVIVPKAVVVDTEMPEPAKRL